MRDPRRPTLLAVALTAVVFAAGQPARANDSLVAVGAGGLRFVKADRIAMQREDLHLSPQEVRIRYEMRNDRNEPFTGRVAFPLPVLRGELQYAPVALPFPGEDNFVRFRVHANGQEVQPTRRVWATLGGRDVTDRLRAEGVEVAPAVARDMDAARFRPDALRRLVALGAFSEPHEVDDGSGKRRVATPQWDTHVAFEWDQRFEPGVTVIEHSYAPVLGGRFAYARGPGQPPLIDDLRGPYCIDRGTEAAIKSAAQAHRRPSPEQAPGMLRTLSYILTTARNWSGPIGTFHLTLDTGAPGNVVSLCLPSLALKRTGPTRFEATARNWTPRRELDVLFYLPRDSGPAETQ